MDERTRHQNAVDALLDKLIEVQKERDQLQEELAYKDHELINCYESNGMVLGG